MNNPAAHIRQAVKSLIAMMAACCVLASCDSVIYDYEGDCTTTYRLQFRYDMNMKFASAFAHEVKSVRVYAFDSAGILAWQGRESGSRLAEDGYSMELPLAAGRYHLVAWCGLDNDDATFQSFTVPEMQVGRSTLSELSCSLNRRRDGSGAAYSDTRLYDLYHGTLDVELPDTLGATLSYTMPLVKDTNHVRVILQHLSGQDVNVDDFTFRIDTDNGLMAHDNAVVADENITYRTYHTGSGVAGLGIDNYPTVGGKAATDGGITAVNVAVADLEIARLCTDVPCYLTIETNGEICARIPLTDYALLLKDGYVDQMDDQEYLDRQDEYALTFFLGDGNQWVNTCVIINAWKLVLADVNF